MKHTKKHTARLNVTCQEQAVGTIATGERGAIYFQYDPGWLKNGFDLAPKMMAFDHSLQLPRNNKVFQGLHGAFNDSLPDGWGLLLMDRMLRNKTGWLPHEINPLDRLAYIGNRAMGALEYRPALMDEKLEDRIDLTSLAEEVVLILEGSDQDVLQRLSIQGGSPGGARPKITIARKAGTHECRSGFMLLPEGFEHWLVKFRAENDPHDMGKIERAYADMAQAAKLEMPETDLIDVTVNGQPESFFAVRRFDRDHNQKRHVLTLSGYAYANHRMPSISYRDVLGITQMLTRNAVEVERAFRLMVFNVFAHNKDDHAKNFSFLHDEEQKTWHLSPAYDLVFSTGPGNEHTTDVGGQGNPSLSEIYKLADEFSIVKAENIVQEVQAAVAQWPVFAERWNVSEQSMRDIDVPLHAIRQRPGSSSR